MWLCTGVAALGSIEISIPARTDRRGIRLMKMNILDRSYVRRRAPVSASRQISRGLWGRA
jgi:hypothetical protein